jgi:hypothetical protein
MAFNGKTLNIKRKKGKPRSRDFEKPISISLYKSPSHFRIVNADMYHSVEKAEKKIRKTGV